MEYERDLQLEELYDQWKAQWDSIEFSNNVPKLDKFLEYQKWVRFREWWAENMKGRTLNEALIGYRIQQKVDLEINQTKNEEK